MAALQNYSRMSIGENAITMELVCNDGKIRMCRTEQFIDGFHAYLIKDDGTYTNNKGYKTATKARNAAAKW
jgi:hypothetical protein